MLRPIVSVVGPGLVLAAAGAWLTWGSAPEPGPGTAANVAALQKNPPGMVIVGNSKVTSDIDAKALAAGIGYRSPIAQVLEPGSSAPAWDAILEGRVYGAGLHPDVVVIYGQLAAMLRAEANTPVEQRAVLDELGDTPSPVLESRVVGDRSSLLGRARRHATASHDRLLSDVRDAAVGLFLAPDGVSADAYATAAMGRLLGSDAKFLSNEAHHAMPVAEVTHATAMEATVTDPAKSLLPELVALVRAHGGIPVLVRAPVSATAQADDVDDPVVERAVVALATSLGVSWIDLHGLDLGATAFRDPMHLGPDGRKALTEALADALARADVVHGGVAKGRPPLAPTSVTRGGPIPAVAGVFRPAKQLACAMDLPVPDLLFLADDQLYAAGLGRSSPLVVEDAVGVLRPHAKMVGLGASCTGEYRHNGGRVVVSPRTAGDAPRVRFSTDVPLVGEDDAKLWLVYPGGSVDWAFGEPWSGDAADVVVEAHVLHGAGAGVVRVGDAEVRLAPEARVLRARVPLPAAAPWRLSVVADPDTWLVLDDVELGDGPPQRLAGHAPATIMPFVGTLAAKADPPAVDLGAPEPVGTLTRYPVPALARLNDDALRDRVRYPCSPVQLAPADAPTGWLKEAHLPRGALEQADRHGYGHLADGLYVAGETAVVARLDPARACAAGRWLYARDELRWVTPPDVSARLSLGANRIVATGVGFAEQGHDSVRVHVRVGAHGGTAVTGGDLELPGSGTTGAACLDLPVALPPAVRLDVTLSVDEGWAVVQTLQLGEAEHLECGA